MVVRRKRSNRLPLAAAACRVTARRILLFHVDLPMPGRLGTVCRYDPEVLTKWDL